MTFELESRFVADFAWFFLVISIFYFLVCLHCFDCISDSSSLPSIPIAGSIQMAVTYTLKVSVLGCLFLVYMLIVIRWQHGSTAIVQLRISTFWAHPKEVGKPDPESLLRG